MKNFVFGFLLFIVVFECNATGTYKTHKQCMQGLWVLEFRNQMNFKVIKGNTSIESIFALHEFDDDPYYSYTIVGFADSSKVDTSSYTATISTVEFLEAENGYRFEIDSDVKEDEFLKTQNECRYERQWYEDSYCNEYVLRFSTTEDGYSRVDSFPPYFMNYICVHHEDDLKYFFNLSRKDFKLGVVCMDSTTVYDENKKETERKIEYGEIVTVLGKSKDFIKFKLERLAEDPIVGYIKKENLDLNWYKSK